MTITQFDIDQINSQQNVYVDWPQSQNSQSGLTVPEGQSAGVLNFSASGKKQGIYSRRVPSCYYANVSVRDAVPVAGSTSTVFAQGLFFEDCGDTYVADADIDLGLFLASDQNTDCIIDNGNGNVTQDYLTSAIHIRNGSFLNAGETILDLKKIGVYVDGSYLGGRCEELVKHWRATIGYYTNTIFDMSNMATPFCFRFRGSAGAQAKLYFWNCRFQMPDGSIADLPPPSTVGFDSGTGGSYANSINLLTSEPAHLSGMAFFAATRGPVDLTPRVEALELQLADVTGRLAIAEAELVRLDGRLDRIAGAAAD